MICKNCGADIDASYGQCPYCGTNVSDAAQVQAPQPTQPEVQYGQNQYMPQGEQPVEDKVSVGIVILAVLIPIVGVIIGGVNMSKGKKHSGKIYLIVGGAMWALGIIGNILLQSAASNDVTQRRSTAQRRCVPTPGTSFFIVA